MVTQCQQFNIIGEVYPVGYIAVWQLWSNINPLNPRSDQHPFSPNSKYTQSQVEVVRVNKMILKREMLWSLIKFSPQL